MTTCAPRSLPQLRDATRGGDDRPCMNERPATGQWGIFDTDAEGVSRGSVTPSVDRLVDEDRRLRLYGTSRFHEPTGEARGFRTRTCWN